MNRVTGFSKGFSNSKEYELAYFDALIADWTSKKHSLVLEFQRIKKIFDNLSFESTDWSKNWQYQKPARPATKIVDAIVFLEQADVYLKARRQQTVLSLEKCSNPSTWANLTQKIHSSFEALHATSPSNAQALADAIIMLSFDLDLTLDFMVTKNKTAQSKSVIINLLKS